MDWAQRIQKAIDYIEEHICDNSDYEKIAAAAYSSSYHFQRMFGIMCGITLGEYIRRRRLTLAGHDLATGNASVTETALKYGYETPESFSRAFSRFHGIKPSQVKQGVALNSFFRINLNIDSKQKSDVKCKIEERPELILTGYKKHFIGAPYGEDRIRQEKEFITTTRAKQWLLLGASCDYSTDYCVITDVSDDGYDFYIAYELDEWTRNDLYNPAVTGVDFMNKMGFETIIVPKTLYAVFETEKKKRPIDDYEEIRNSIASDRLPFPDYAIAESPEVTVLHWRPKGEWAKERYIEICLPIEIKGRK